MREAREKFLPPNPAESTAAYEARLALSVFTNFYVKTISFMTSKLLHHPPVPTEDTTDETKALLEDVDACGNRLDVFARELVQASIDDGVAHILVDSPSINPESNELVTLADEQAQRPFARIVRARDVLNWDSETSEGRERLTRVHIREFVEVEDPDLDFANKTVERIRVIEPNKVTVWQQDEADGQWAILEEITTDFDEIPLVSFYTRKLDFMVGTPTLLDLAFLNVKHWQADSDQAFVSHIARVPILNAVGFDSDGSSSGTPTFIIGPNNVIVGPPGSELKYVEINGKNLEIGRAEVDDLEAKIRKLGSEVILGQKPGNVTATARALDSAEASIDLASIALDLEDALNGMVAWLGFWTSQDEPGGVSVFKDFKALSRDGEDLNVLLKLFVAKALSLDTLLNEVQRRGLLAPDVNLADEVAQIELDGERDMQAIAASLGDE